MRINLPHLKEKCYMLKVESIQDKKAGNYI